MKLILPGTPEQLKDNGLLAGVDCRPEKGCEAEIGENGTIFTMDSQPQGDMPAPFLKILENVRNQARDGFIYDRDGDFGTIDDQMSVAEDFPIRDQADHDHYYKIIGQSSNGPLMARADKYIKLQRLIDKLVARGLIPNKPALQEVKSPEKISEVIIPVLVTPSPVPNIQTDEYFPVWAITLLSLLGLGGLGLGISLPLRKRINALEKAIARTHQRMDDLPHEVESKAEGAKAAASVALNLAHGAQTNTAEHAYNAKRANDDLAQSVAAAREVHTVLDQVVANAKQKTGQILGSGEAALQVMAGRIVAQIEEGVHTLAKNAGGFLQEVDGKISSGKEALSSLNTAILDARGLTDHMADFIVAAKAIAADQMALQSDIRSFDGDLEGAKNRIYWELMAELEASIKMIGDDEKVALRDEGKLIVASINEASAMVIAEWRQIKDEAQLAIGELDVAKENLKSAKKERLDFLREREEMKEIGARIDSSLEELKSQFVRLDDLKSSIQGIEMSLPQITAELREKASLEVQDHLNFLKSMTDAAANTFLKRAMENDIQAESHSAILKAAQANLDAFKTSMQEVERVLPSLTPENINRVVDELRVLAGAEQNLVEHVKTLEAAADRNSDKIDGLSRRQSNVDSTSARLETAITVLQSQIASLEGNNRKRNDDLKKITAMEGSIADLSARLNRLFVRISGGEELSREHDSRINAIEFNSGKVDKALRGQDVLSRKIAAYMGKQKGVESRLDRNETTVLDLEGQVGQLSQAVQNLESTLKINSVSPDQITLLRTELAVIKNTLTVLQVGARVAAHESASIHKELTGRISRLIGMGSVIDTVDETPASTHARSRSGSRKPSSTSPMARRKELPIKHPQPVLWNQIWWDVSPEDRQKMPGDAVTMLDLLMERLVSLGNEELSLKVKILLEHNNPEDVWVDLREVAGRDSSQSVETIIKHLSLSPVGTNAATLEWMQNGWKPVIQLPQALPVEEAVIVQPLDSITWESLLKNTGFKDGVEVDPVLAMSLIDAMTENESFSSLGDMLKARVYSEGAQAQQLIGALKVETSQDASRGIDDLALVMRDVVVDAESQFIDKLPKQSSTHDGKIPSFEPREEFNKSDKKPNIITISIIFDRIRPGNMKVLNDVEELNAIKSLVVSDPELRDVRFLVDLIEEHESALVKDLGRMNPRHINTAVAKTIIDILKSMEAAGMDLREQVSVESSYRTHRDHEANREVKPASKSSKNGARGRVKKERLIKGAY